MRTTYEQLSQRINEIIDNFAVDIDPFLQPSVMDEDNIRAMIILSHAEFESYLVDLVMELLDEGQKELAVNSVANANIISLFLNSEKKKRGDTKSYSFKCIKDFKNSIKNKAEIKSGDLYRMFHFLGYGDSIFSASINEVDRFDAKKLEMSYLPTDRIQNPLNYNDEKLKILQILSDIKEPENRVVH